MMSYKVPLHDESFNVLNVINIIFFFVNFSFDVSQKPKRESKPALGSPNLRLWINWCKLH